MDPLHIYDPVTAEVLKPEDLLKDLDRLSDAELAELVSAAEALDDDLDKVVKKLQASLVSRQQARSSALQSDVAQSNVEVPKNA